MPGQPPKAGRDGAPGRPREGARRGGAARGVRGRGEGRDGRAGSRGPDGAPRPRSALTHLAPRVGSRPTRPLGRPRTFKGGGRKRRGPAAAAAAPVPAPAVTPGSGLQRAAPGRAEPGRAAPPRLPPPFHPLPRQEAGHPRGPGPDESGAGRGSLPKLK